MNEPAPSAGGSAPDGAKHVEPAHKSSGVVAFWGQRVWGDTAHLLLLTMLVVVAHAVGVLHDTEGYYRRHAATANAASELDQPTIARAASDVHRVQMLEVSAKLRTQWLERQVDAADRAVQRLGGVRPIDRCEFAALLQDLADKRAAPTDVRNPAQIIAIDVDVTPLNAADETRCGDTMATALRALRAGAVVIAITTPREDVAEADVRNRFMSKTCGTGQGPGALHYASPAVFHERHGYPLDFLHSARAAPSWPWLDRLLRFVHLAGNPPDDAAAEAAPVFPSLGNLLALAAWPAGQDKAQTQHALNSLCRLAGKSSSGHRALLESLLGGRSAVDCEVGGGAAGACAPQVLHSYNTAAYNWRWLHPDRLLSTPITRRQPFGCAEIDCVDKGVLTAAPLMISIDGGDQQDKFDVPQAAADPVSGAAMHALQALSIDPDDDLELHSIWGLVIDLLVGLVFLAAWKLMAVWIATWSELPSLSFMAGLVTPAAIALVLYALTLHVISPTLLTSNVWANPAYVLLGLVAHAYTEVAHSAGHGVHAKPPDFSFGLRRALTGQEHGRRKVDAVLSAGAQCAIVASGLYALHNHHALTGTGLLGVVAILAAVSYAQHLSSRRRA